jgi:hypothetical protein
VAEVLEALHTRGNDYEDVGVVAGGGSEGVREARRDDDEVSAFGGDDPVSRQELGGTVKQVEQLGGVGMAVRPGTVGATAERDALRGQGTAGGAGIGQQADSGGGPADDLGVGGADDHGLSEAGAG